MGVHKGGPQWGSTRVVHKGGPQKGVHVLSTPLRFLLNDSSKHGSEDPPPYDRCSLPQVTSVRTKFLMAHHQSAIKILDTSLSFTQIAASKFGYFFLKPLSILCQYGSASFFIRKSRGVVFQEVSYFFA